MSKFKNLTGMRFGKLTAVKIVKNCEHKCKSVIWQCKCDCGNIVNVRSSNLINGHTKSCGCIRKEIIMNRDKERAIHNDCNSRLYRIWHGMKNRCNNPNAYNYKNYGGRGITIRPEWEEFIPFREWSNSNGYADNLTIDRIDVNGNYCPENCRWADIKTQNNNTTRNRLLTAFGETMNVAQWSEKVGIKRGVIYNRIDTYKWDVEKALTTPVEQRKPRIKGDVD